MGTRRTIVWIGSAVVGVISTVGVIAAFGTTPEKFSYSNVVLFFLSMAAVAFIWLDYFMKTGFLKR